MAIAEVALAQAAVEQPPGAPSVYAAVRRAAPPLQPQRLQKSSLIALSWAIEDECCARAERPVIFGAFQEERYFRAAEERWTELARIARSTIAFADFGHRRRNPWAERSSSTFPTTLPCGASGQSSATRRTTRPCSPPGSCPASPPSPIGNGSSRRSGPSSRRPSATAARACAQVALQLGHPEAAPLLYELAENPPAPPAELLQATSLLNRVVAYVDQMA